jgi:hypothetical protein
MYEEIIPDMDIRAYAAERRLRFVRKDRSRLHRFIGKLCKVVGYDYMNRAWTTIGRTVAFPVWGPDIELEYDGAGIPICKGTIKVHGGGTAHATEADMISFLDFNESIFGHEAHHVEQHLRLWWLHEVLYFLGTPLPIIFAWYRAWCEVRPYAWQCAFFERDQVKTVNTIWKLYGFPWPKGWLAEWLANTIFELRLMPRRERK